MIGALREVIGEQLGAQAFSPTGHPNETIGALLAGLEFHEACHPGQTGLGRRLLESPVRWRPMNNVKTRKGM